MRSRPASRARCLLAAFVAALSLGASAPFARAVVQPTAEFVPHFVADELLVTLTVDTMPHVPADPAQPRTPAELFALTGVELVRELSSDPGTLQHTFLVRLPAGDRELGHAFQRLQAFRFTDASQILGIPELSLHGFATIQLAAAGVPSGYVSYPLPRRVSNYSTRAHVGAGERVTIGGLIVPGTFPRLVVIRALGPSLAGVLTEPLADPSLDLHDGTALVLANDDHGTLRDWEKRLAATLLPPPVHDRESVIVTYLDPGNYTAIVRGKGDATGVALLEFYLVEPERVAVPGPGIVF